MLNYDKTIFFFFFLQTINLCLSHQDYHFDYMSYDTILAKITEFEKNYPQYIKIKNITDNDIDFPNIGKCGNNKYIKVIFPKSYFL